ncbi:MAG: outer membrane beta-barrel protein [Pseudomonadota bacterium]
MRNSLNEQSKGRHVLRAVSWTFCWALFAFAAVALAAPAEANASDRLIDGGLYGGVQGGYAIPDARFSLDDAGLGDLKADGFRVGGFVGYAHRDGNLFGAVELDGGLATGDGMLEAVGTEFRIEPEFTAGASILAGAVIADRGMLYARAGYQALVIEASLAGTETREVLHGARVGVGAAVAVTDRVAIRAEYLYSFFGDKDYRAGPTRLQVEAEQGVARVGLVFGF